MEDGLTLPIAKLVKKLLPLAFEQRCNGAGVLQWTFTRSSESAGRIGCALKWQDDTSWLTLDYSVKGQPVNYDVCLTTTACRYGGVRYWLVCPHCGRRSGCLYLPPGATRFYCRQCHDLTYTSSQEAHKYDVMGRQLGVNLGWLDRIFEASTLVECWYNKERLTRGERRKIVDYLGVPISRVRRKRY